VDDYREDDATKHTDLADCQAEVEHLRAMLRSRQAIEQAKGILMARHGCSPDRAFDMLSAASQRTNRKLQAVAQAIVDSVQEKVHQDAAG
jgi:AmiR/NasT family two-component response regulator